MKQRTLDKAKEEKKDEFYTLLADIEKEMRHYKEQFRGKVIFCNCDDPYESNFFKYFALNFNYLELKKLIATCYIGSPIANRQLSLFDYETVENKTTRTPHKIVINEAIDENQDGAFDLQDIVTSLASNEKNTLTRLSGDGDFRSSECVELLKQADIVVTNPPFSLFREYVAQLVDYNKNFIIIGNTNALTYKEIFKLFKENKIRTGYTNFNIGMHFIVPDEYDSFQKIENGKKIVRVSTSCWFTNLDVEKHLEKLTLYKNYSPKKYPRYENYNAINCDTYTDIPCDYFGAMGVPITFLDKYNPEQFEIIGLGISNSGIEIGVKPYRPEHKKYRKEVQKRGAVDGDLYMITDGVVDVPYARIIIKRKGENL
ncbi:MAG: adenine-specific methyltransferase EcoRI family protein [Firmicutes bacterium]|nr:adenine-specific methyltransferase EcoRI family protein [Bacillota bacterium]